MSASVITDVDASSCVGVFSDIQSFPLVPGYVVAGTVSRCGEQVDAFETNEDVVGIVYLYCTDTNCGRSIATG